MATSSVSSDLTTALAAPAPVTRPSWPAEFRRDQAPVIAAILIVGVAASYLQHGFLVGGERLAEDKDLDAAFEVVERGEHHVVALLRADLLRLRDDPADGHPFAVATVGERGEREGDVIPELVRETPQRAVGAERLIEQIAKGCLAALVSHSVEVGQIVSDHVQSRVVGGQSGKCC